MFHLKILGYSSGMSETTAPFPEVTGREVLLSSTDPGWVSPYTPEQAVAVAIFNEALASDLGDAIKNAKGLTRWLAQMGFEVRFTGVRGGS